MKDAISKLTFGFLMGQLFPGAIATTAVTLTFLAMDVRLPGSLVASVDDLLVRWSSASPAHHIFLLGLCIGFGMFIHGINWAMLGTLEKEGKISIFNSRWHRTPIVVQIMGAPFRMIFELILLACARTTAAASIYENVPRVADSAMKQHEFLQEFYLYSAQFFAHTAWALVGVEATLAVFIYEYGWTQRRIVLALLLYLAAGMFFTIARIQLCSLFRGEGELKDVSAWNLIKEAVTGV